MDKIEKAIYNRTELLLGEDVMQEFSRTRVIIFGVGGVGSWCAEGLVRSGITHLTIVDSDRVSITNVNRQLMATTQDSRSGQGRGSQGSSAGNQSQCGN